MAPAQWALRNLATDQEYAVPLTGLQIGRADTNDVVLSSDQVSRQHATIWMQDGTLLVQDRGSLNGTLVNDERIATPTALRSGDRIRIGEATFEVATTAGSPVEAVTPQPARMEHRSSMSGPVIIAGGVVLTLVVALLIRGAGTPVILPTATPTASPTPKPTIAVVPTNTPMSTEVPVVTEGPTPPLPPSPQVLPPERIAPQEGREYSNPIVFQWSSSSGPGHAYQVTAYHRESGHQIQSGVLMDDQWTTSLPADRFGEWRWTVSVIRGGSIEATSSESMFWFQPFPRR